MTCDRVVVNRVQFIQQYMIKVVSDLRQGGEVLRSCSTNKNDLHITEMFLKVALSTLTLTLTIHTVNVKMYFEWSKYFIKPLPEILFCIAHCHHFEVITPEMFA